MAAMGRSLTFGAKPPRCVRCIRLSATCLFLIFQAVIGVIREKDIIKYFQSDERFRYLQVAGSYPFKSFLDPQGT